MIRLIYKQIKGTSIMYKRFLAVLAVPVFFMMVNPAQAVFIGAGNGNLYQLDVTTNTSTLLGNSGSAMFDIALDPITDVLYGVSGGGTLVSIDKTNASSTAIGGTGSFINGLTFDSSGILYGSGGSGLYTIDLVNGAASFVGSTGFTSSGDLAFDTNGNLFMSATGGTGGDRLISVNSASGTGSLIGDIGFSGVYGLNFAGATLNGFTSSGLSLVIDTLTGVGTQIAVNSINTFGADGVGGVSVPEPATLLIMATGLAGIGFAGRKKRS
ncbi:MAG: PEP-CTERM sorting domain-containing protein [Gammaproteobacteria bacterium]|nr:PEP-CTERM sorting domain-containing protein [Gammaproteobacteria bacterium]